MLKTSNSFRKLLLRIINNYSKTINKDIILLSCEDLTKLNELASNDLLRASVIRDYKKLLNNKNIIKEIFENEKT